MPADWTVFALPDDLARERYTALLAALEELSTRGPMSSLEEITAQVRSVGFHNPLPESELRETLDQLAKWGFAEPFRDYTAPVRNYQGLIVRREAWALTRKGRGVVAAVRPTEDLAGLQQSMQSKAAEAHLLGQLVQPLSDPVWRAELSYPFHVAGLARHYRTAHQVDVRKESLLKLGESLARSLGVIALAIMIQRSGEFSPALANPFIRGAGATFGAWTTLLSDFLRGGDVPELPVFESMRGPDGALSILQEIKNHRNASGHAFGVRPAHERDAEVKRLKPIVVAALESMPWLARLHWDLIEHCGYIGPGYTLQGRRLRGSHPEWEPLDEKYHEQLAPHRIYLRGPLLTASIDLTPVASVGICDVCDQRELFLINRAKVSGGRVIQLTLRSDKDHEVVHDLP
ncbi:hypothetical protein [Nonomuraea monospora]